MADKQLHEPPLTDDEARYLRALIQQDKNSKYVWRVLRTHLPWVAGIASSVIAGLYWFFTHFTFVKGGGPP